MTSNNEAQNRAITDATQIASSQATTPASVQIKPRNRSHDIAEALQGEWLDQNAFLTAVFNGMSITFPAGEKFFIDSVRHFAGDVTDPVL
ncbi:MAG: putative metal-dependent hydrolase, partial [Halieaceae bacterium]